MSDHREKANELIAEAMYDHRREMRQLLLQEAQVHATLAIAEMLGRLVRKT
ncbi:hypothetical protein SEA_PONS_67 [Gordonia phage Pons]|nr:hypothetical protein PP992_gp67 [Gordonia phage Pons]YP_010663201.1 hypothetical protein PP994_gp66 [Gordonia phage CherryonLim]QFP95819.1 hypothetical protein SEA_CHERRYONLIM_66 [Gordonia phage CherryonLim]UDL15227.1 hypothetical protein SEA_PONS_67 [Gordonia phage Pons]